jgi:hypothetical protein
MGLLKGSDHALPEELEVEEVKRKKIRVLDPVYDAWISMPWDTLLLP